MKRLFLAFQLVSFAVASCFAMAFAAPKSALIASQSNVKASKNQKKATQKKAKKAPVATATATTAPAQQTATTTAPAAALSPAKPTKNLSASVSLARTNSLNNYQDGSEQASWDSTFLASYKLSQNYSVTGLIERSDDIKNSDNSDWQSASIRLSHAAISIFDNNMTVAPRLSMGLPISKAQRLASFQTSLGLSARLAANSDKLFSKKLSLSTGWGISRSIHQYDTAKSGAVNNQYSSTQDLVVGWSFTEDLGLSLEVVHYNYWSYQGTMKEFYSHNQELSYAIDPQFSVAIGHSLGRRTVWNSDSSSYEYKLIDEDDSLVYGSLTYTY